LKQKNFTVKGNCLVLNSISIIKLCEVIACDKNIKLEKLTLEENVLKTITAKDQGWGVVALSKYNQSKKILNGNYLRSVFNWTLLFTIWSISKSY